MKRIILLAGVLLTSILFGSCSGELDIPKKGNMGSVEDFYKTDQDAEAAIAACYLDLKVLYTPVKSIDNLLSDDLWCGGEARNDNAPREDIGAYIHSTTNEFIQSLYERLYQMIYHSNLVIEKMENVETPIKKRDIAEAYFFRGFAHFYLGTYFGTAPVVDHLLGVDEYHQTNGSKETLFAQAEDDLRKAIGSEALPSKEFADKNVRICKETASAYLGKVLVFSGKYSDAAAVLKGVIDSGKYGLWTGEYNYLLHQPTDYCEENILEWNAPLDRTKPTAKMSDLSEYFNLRPAFYEPLPGELGLVNNGYGFYNPTKNLYDAFVAEEGEDGFRLNQVIKTYDQMQAMGIKILSGKTLHGHEGYWGWKFRFLKQDQGVFPLDVVANYVFMRYAEVLLLCAEACLQSGDAATAEKCLNLVRSRVHLAEKHGITMEDIKTEKRLELFGEGLRWMDLVRWGDAASVLKDKGKVNMGFNGHTAIKEYETTSQGFVAGKHEVLPIPDMEIRLNDKMSQNPNW